MTIPDIIQQRLRELHVGQGDHQTLAGWCRQHGLDYRATWRWMQDPAKSNVKTTLRICRALGLAVEDVCQTEGAVKP